MKAVIVMYDTLNRHFLPSYGNDWVKAPNFQRLAEKSVTFEKAYSGSLPTIPTRREMHTGRHNFLHRAWGPVEPFDDSMPQMLLENGVHTHLASDGYHYWEDGGATYHNRYGSWEFFRGQEGDLWKADLSVEIPEGCRREQDWINRQYIKEEGDWPQSGTFSAACRFLETNAGEDKWLLHAETFDPHEPYYAPQKYRDLYPHEWDGPPDDWPGYAPQDTPGLIEHYRCEYAALLSMCDASLGRVLDLFDELDIWKDTMLIVNTDHGFMLGEHGWTGKGRMPCYEEVSHIPLFIWDPRSGRKGQRCPCLVQTIDLAPTLMEYFGVNRPADMQGQVLKETIAGDQPVREAGLFGWHGGHVNVTDGRYVYMRAPAKPDGGPLFNYTLFPTTMRGYYPPETLAAAELVGPFSFTKNCKLVKLPSDGKQIDAHGQGTLLFDLETDPRQDRAISDPAVEKKMIAHMVRLMKENDAPPEQFERLGLEA